MVNFINILRQFLEDMQMLVLNIMVEHVDPLSPSDLLLFVEKPKLQMGSMLEPEHEVAFIDEFDFWFLFFDPEIAKVIYFLAHYFLQRYAILYFVVIFLQERHRLDLYVAIFFRVVEGKLQKPVDLLSVVLVMGLIDIVLNFVHQKVYVFTIILYIFWELNSLQRLIIYFL